ncbi:MAG: restriction endonuclease subunit S [Pyrinomonadaceae bacterium]|nr:restriction endonuclease subunit S [Pyrinomonadaceae bacterium]
MNDSKNEQPFYNSTIPSDWQSPEFGLVFSFLKTFAYSREQLSTEKTFDEIRNIHYGDIHATYIDEILDFEKEERVPYLKDGIIELEKFEEEEFPALKDGDLIIADASEDYEGICDSVEVANLKNRNVVAGLHTFAARSDENKVVKGFRTYTLKSEQVVRELRRVATGISVFGVSKTNLSKIKIPLPPLLEQKAIAHVLGLMDSVINQHNQLIAQKNARKKWLMQNLLTGKKRLKGFGNSEEFQKTDLGLQIPKDWKVICVEEVFNERNQTSNDKMKYPLYSLTIENGLVQKTERYERSFLLRDKENNQYKIVYKDDILFNPMNLRFGAIAKSNVDFPVLVSAYYNVIKPSNDSININYFEKLFKTEVFRNLYERIAIGSLMEKKRVHLSNLFKLQIPFPTLAEQTAIAQILQSADKEITLLKTKTEKLQEQKKWLMQQLLTGKKRLKVNNEK